MVRVNNVKLRILKCKRCGYRWVPKVGHKPKRCARCKSKYWTDTPEREGASRKVKRSWLDRKENGVQEKHDKASPKKGQANSQEHPTVGDDPHYEGSDFVGS